MCPLRVILIFLSATLAGIFLIRNLHSSSPSSAAVDPTSDDDVTTTDNKNTNGLQKVRSIVETGFWTFVDMASGKFLWRHLVSNDSSLKHVD